MDLLIDIGNTNLHWATAEQLDLEKMQVIQHHAGFPMKILTAWENLNPQRILVSHVAKREIATGLSETSQMLWGLQPQFALPQAEFAGLQIAYADPHRFGVDRWLGLIAVYRELQRATLIIDAGSAITYDGLLADGQHLGGLILPGLELMRMSLFNQTALQASVSIPLKTTCWANHTAAAIHAGSTQAIGALAERLFDQLAQKSQAVPRLVLSGGDANQLETVITHPLEIIPDLVLRGLAHWGQADHAKF